MKLLKASACKIEGIYCYFGFVFVRRMHRASQMAIFRFTTLYHSERMGTLCESARFLDSGQLLPFYLRNKLGPGAVGYGSSSILVP